MPTAEWLAHDRDASFLLRGQDLEAAETLVPNRVGAGRRLTPSERREYLHE
jgi:hypothetical protein